MAILKFYDQFVPDVKSGRKLSTIRSEKKGEVDDTVELFDTSGNMIGEGVLTVILPIKICGEVTAINRNIYLNGGKDTTEIAISEGFKNFEEMKTWFDNQYGLPFSGWLHVWELKGK